MKHLVVSMSVKQNLSVSVFVHKCLMVLNDVEYTTFKMFVTQMSNYLFVISFQLMFYKTLLCSLARPYLTLSVKNLNKWHAYYNGCQGRKLYFHKRKIDLRRITFTEDSSSYLFLMLVFRINSFSMTKEKNEREE